jgi:mono/diheme cytochrome c family protein
MGRFAVVTAGAAAIFGLAIAKAEPPAPGGKATAPTAAQATFFEKEVRPILAEKCVVCHAGGPGTSGGLALTDRATLLKGGNTGPAVNLADPKLSLLVRAIHYKESLKMPPQGPLPEAEVTTLTHWVEMGAPWPAGPAADSLPARHGPPPVNAETMRFWSFRPVRRPQPPAVKHKEWVRTPIDAFILSKLERTGLTPAAPASRTALLRRATYDLTGLPPTPAEVRAFLADRSPNAYEKVIDRLLASPHYGERWARHWLDLVRYAETNSFERDDPKPFAWRYRDYVIRALNADTPYDRFVREQLAGDELEQVTPDTLIATGYYRLGAWDDEPSDPEQARYDELDDIVATTGQVFLGLTVNCARCHDHKIDPIPQKDYYRLLAFFQGVTRYGDSGGDSVGANSLRPIAPEEQVRQHDALVKDYERELNAVNTRLAEIEKAAQQDFSPVDKEEFKSEQNQVPLIRKRVPKLLSAATFDAYVRLRQDRKRLQDAPPPALAQALCVTESGRTPAKTCILMRGSPHAPGDPVEPGFPSVLAPPNPEIHEPVTNPNSSGRRLALANWIASPDNKLTARVMVNRIWQHHFGRGIVRSPSNFGFLGTPPTHPELLDWLASEFVRGGWKLKPLHRLIMLSSAYRMSSQAEPHALAKDPENDLCWRFDMRRLDAEEIRDSILAVNGSLDLNTMYGPSIYPTIPKEVLAGQSRPGYGWDTSPPEAQARRSIYVHIKRSLALPILASFDAADTDFTCPVRFATTQPTQALGLLNSAFINQQAGVFAEFLRHNAGADVTAQVRLGLQRTLQREPTALEIARGVRFYARMQQRYGVGPQEALRLTCVIFLNLNEFVYLD